MFHLRVKIIFISFLDDSNKLETNEVLLPSMMKKVPRGAHPNPSHEAYDVDMDFVYVAFKDRYIFY